MVGLPQVTECLLAGYGKCGGGKIDWHHFINLGKSTRSKEARVYMDKIDEVFREKGTYFFKVPVCHKHNISREADSKWARRKILEHLVEIHGVGVTRAIIDAVPWKLQPPELSYAGIMEGPSKEKWR